MAWYNSSWPYRKKITIDADQVDAALTGFPLVVPLDSLTQNTTDVVFTGADGETVLPHEVASLGRMGTGGWSWFSNPRAVYHDGKTFVGTIDGSGNLYVGQYTHATNDLVWTLLTATLQVDDHDHPALYVRPSDGRIVAFYSKHGNDALLRYKISTNAGDATAWGSEQTVTHSGNCTYANPVSLSADSGACYVFSRIWEASGDSNWTYARTGNFSAWDAPVEFWDSGAFQQYLHCATNGTDRIDFFSSDKHPDNDAGGCSLYHFYCQWDSGTSALKWYNSAGVEKTLPMDHTKATLVYDGTTNDGWSHQIAIDSNGLPRVLFQKRVSTVDTGDMRLMFSRWDGAEWTNPVEITPHGGYVYSGEPSYTGGACFDGADIDRIYLGKQVDGIYEMQEWYTTDNGATWAKLRDITKRSNSGTINFRPFSPLNHHGRLNCIFCCGTYDSYTNYNLSAYAVDVQAMAYVRVTSVSDSADTDIYCYYGGVGGVQNPEGTWDGYLAAYHMRPHHTTLLDVTGNNIDGDLNGGVSQLIKGAGFDRSNDYISLGTGINLAGRSSVSVETFVNCTLSLGSFNEEHQIVSSWSPANNVSAVMLRLEPVSGANCVEAFAMCQADTQKGANFTDAVVTANTDTFVGMSFDASSIRGFAGTTKSATTPATGAELDAVASGPTWIGASPHSSYEFFGGKIYEVWIAEASLSDAWMKTRAVNLQAPATLMSYGSEEEDVADDTAPVISSLFATATGTTTATLTLETDEGNGSIFFLLDENTTATEDAILAGLSQSVTATGEQTIDVTALDYNTTYYAHVLHRDAASNVSNILDSEPFRTLDLSIALDFPDTAPCSLLGYQVWSKLTVTDEEIAAMWSE